MLGIGNYFTTGYLQRLLNFLLRIIYFYGDLHIGDPVEIALQSFQILLEVFS